MCTVLRRVFAGAGVFAVMSAAWAVETVWQGGDGAFSDPSKWSSAAVPGEEDAVRFDVAGAAAVSFTQDATVSNAVVDAAQNAPLTFDLGGNRWTVKDRFQFPASSQSGVVTLQNGLLSCLGNEVLLSRTRRNLRAGVRDGRRKRQQKLDRSSCRGPVRRGPAWRDQPALDRERRSERFAGAREG
jgi:hypothetical protein